MSRTNVVSSTNERLGTYTNCTRADQQSSDFFFRSGNSSAGYRRVSFTRFTRFLARCLVVVFGFAEIDRCVDARIRTISGATTVAHTHFVHGIGFVDRWFYYYPWWYVLDQELKYTYIRGEYKQNVSRKKIIRWNKKNHACYFWTTEILREQKRNRESSYLKCAS